MKNLTAQEIQDFYSKNLKKTYQKKGKYLWRPAVPLETVLTIVEGRLETMKTSVLTGDIVLRNIEINSSAEMYIVSKETFDKRYTLLAENYTIDGKSWWTASANGQVNAFQYFGETITFDAPWAEQMVCEDGDFIASPVGGQASDVYRIEKNTFLKTYGEPIE